MYVFALINPLLFLLRNVNLRVTLFPSKGQTLDMVIEIKCDCVVYYGRIRQMFEINHHCYCCCFGCFTACLPCVDYVREEVVY